MAKLRIESLHNAVWKIFGFQHDQAVADRDRLRTTIEHRLGHEKASEVQRYVDVALGRVQAGDLPNPQVVKMREFYELLAAEMAVREIADRIEANAVFVDPDDGLLSTLGLSWRQDVLPLIDGKVSPGYMRSKNVEKLLGMVGAAAQQLPVEEETDSRRRELIEFLEKAIKVGQPVWCNL
jgi:hypothetical protein